MSVKKDQLYLWRKLHGGFDGNAMREHRKRNDIRMEAVAKDVGVSVTTLYQWERGDIEPTCADMIALADAIGILPGALLKKRFVDRRGVHDDCKQKNVVG